MRKVPEVGWKVYKAKFSDKNNKDPDTRANN